MFNNLFEYLDVFATMSVLIFLALVGIFICLFVACFLLASIRRVLRHTRDIHLHNWNKEIDGGRGDGSSYSSYFDDRGFATDDPSKAFNLVKEDKQWHR